VPRESKYCYARVWGVEGEQNEDIWLEVKKFREPRLPTIPEVCQKWVNREDLRNISDIPELKERIAVEKTEEDPKTGESYVTTETFSVEDHPEVTSSWEGYLENQWFPWTELYSRYIAVQEVYANLFSIYQEQQKLGEQYELVFCFGLLTWKTPSNQVAHRHLIAIKVSLEFEPHAGKFTLYISPGDDVADLELDMLDIQHQPQNARQLLETSRAILRENLLDRSAIEPILVSIAHSLSDGGQGEYQGDRLEPENQPVTTKPLVEYAPALILRKRSLRGLESMLAKMKEQVEGGCAAPREFLDLCESLDGANTADGVDPQRGGQETDVEIYFPLPSNEEQRRIIRTLDRQNGVLVQGPPGTGKSHTIANLICHLLATGKRVLVTAKTPRALQVLHSKLPDEIKPLCINLLGSGSDEQESLEKSVVGILNQLDRRLDIDAEREIAVIKNRIDKYREAKRETDNRLLAIRESETYQHAISSGSYTGSAAVIAKRIREDEDRYGWFTDTLPESSSLPITQDEVSALKRALVGIT
jgi:hypothetical protein